MAINDRRKAKPLAAGRRRHHGVIDLRDTGDENRMRVVRDQNARRDMLNPGETNVRPLKPVRQIDDPYFKTEVTVEKKNKDNGNI